ncbi:ABC transporter substrate-binding protein (plasmid) [Rhizobium lusitanum]|uniref:ABC transporter substrate-binding protein n=1 Tax=Rhizobium lusitanum TaxID=293958 RepID=UPI00161BFA76|nr:ABC transporter substrate-binding protein [Rhizobium lusitanum]QND46514.1 ABC transporter substrate-binding protein [Rhizobium lusitanum]
MPKTIASIKTGSIVRKQIVAIAALLIAFTIPTLARADIILNDLKGRTITLAKPASRVLVDDGRLILALSFLTDDPVNLVAAWPHDVDRFGRELYATYRQRFPAIDSLPKSTSSAQDMVAEQVIAAKPDLVVLSLYSHPAEQQLEQLSQVGIPVIFIDFVADPFANSDRSLQILGKAIGRETEADKVIAFRKQQKDLIAERVAKTDPSDRPAVFMETHASTQEACCNSPGTGNVGKFIDFVDARNIGDILAGKPFGQISLEYALSSKPDVYIASGGEYMAKRGGLLIGPHYSAQDTRDTMAKLLDRPGFAAIPAVTTGAVHGLSQQIFNSPLDLLALELIAKWTHPKLFQDIDVEATRRTLNGFMAVPLTGTYWTD